MNICYRLIDTFKLCVSDLDQQIITKIDITNSNNVVQYTRYQRRPESCFLL